MGRISVELSDELEKKLRFKTIERFGGRKGDLTRAVEEAVEMWVNTNALNPTATSQRPASTEQEIENKGKPKIQRSSGKQRGRTQRSGKSRRQNP